MPASEGVCFLIRVGFPVRTGQCGLAAEGGAGLWALGLLCPTLGCTLDSCTGASWGMAVLERHGVHPEQPAKAAPAVPGRQFKDFRVARRIQAQEKM